MADNWIPIDEAVAFAKLVNWMCPRLDQSAWKYLNIRVDTRDNHATVWAASDRHSEPVPISAERIREYMDKRRITGCGFTSCCKRPLPDAVPEPATETRRVLPPTKDSTPKGIDLQSRIREMRKLNVRYGEGE